MPFFLGKNINVIDNSETEGDADEDDDVSDKASKYLVEIHEHVQTENNVGEPTGKHQLHNEHGEREKRVQKPRNPRQSLRKSQTGQNYLLIDKMNSDKSLPKATMKHVSYNCEVAARSEVFKCPELHKFAVDLGRKPMPEEEK